jgi:hypothetical protein
MEIVQRLYHLSTDYGTGKSNKSSATFVSTFSGTYYIGGGLETKVDPAIPMGIIGIGGVCVK